MAEAAGRIARALLRKAVLLGRAEAVARDLELLSWVVASNPDVMRFINHPRIPLADKEKLLCPAAAEELTRRLLSTLIAGREATLLPEIHTSYALLLRRRTGLIDAAVTAAEPLTPEEETGLGAAVERITGRKAVLHVTIDPELIGGIRLTLDGRVFDGSLRTTLESIKERLLAS